MMKYLQSTWWFTLTVTAKDILMIKWMVDASFAVHLDFKSHTGVTLQFGGMSIGSIISVSRKQKLNTKSSTEAELVGANDITSLILWTQLFMEEQGYPIKRNVLYQDNKSAILLEKNGRMSSSKRTKHIKSKIFFVTDRIADGEVVVEYCPTDQMWCDANTKPKQGTPFRRDRSKMLNCPLIPVDTA